MPKTIRPHGISPPTIPCASCAIRPACGAESSRSPMPMPPCLMLAWCSQSIGKTSTKAVVIVAMISAISIFLGVPPSRCPTLRSWIRLPETQIAQQTTAETPRTAPTPCRPVTPNATMSSAARISAESVRPETGWFDPPTRPTR